PPLGVRFGDIRRVEDRGRTLARLVEQRQGAGGRGVGELPLRRVDAVLGDRVGRQQRQHSRPVLLLSPLFCTAGVAGVLLRECRRHRERGQQDEKGGAAETDHLFVPY